MKLRITKLRLASFAITTLAVLALLLSFSIITATPSYAACFNPAGSAGNVLYNAGYRTFQYCNGGSWQKMGGAGDTATGLVGWWKLDDGAGTSAIDSSGNGNTGTLQNTPAWTTSGMNNGALTFNGTNQFVTAPDVAPLQLSGSWTVSSWVNFSALPASGNASVLVQKIGAAINYELLVDNGDSCGAGLGWTAYFSVPVVGGICAKYLSSISTGTWYHVVGVWDSSSGNQYVYLNGQLVLTRNTGGVVPPSGSGMPLAIGAGVYGNYLTTGTIDDVRVYNRALTAADVMTLYTSTGGASGDITTGLKGYWKLDDGSGTTAADSSGNGNTGTLTGSPRPAWTTSGKINDALSFNGSTAYVNVPDAAPLNIAGSWTVSTWVNLSTLPTSGNAYSFLDRLGSSGLNENYGLWVDNGWFGYPTPTFMAQFAYGSGANVYVGYVPTGGILASTWYLVTGTWDGTNLTLYVNGVSVATSVPGVVPDGSAGGSLQIGQDANSTYTAGTLDDVRIYNRALSASDVLTLYNATATACASPVGYAGNMIYNAGTYHVLQYCDGSVWQPMGKVPGAGGSGCTSPAGSEGHIMYSSDYRVIQYCDGTTWRAAGRTIPIPGLVGWWNMDEGSGTSAADSSGSGNTGTLFNTPAWTTSGKINGAMTFNGTGQYVDAGDPASLELAGSWTVAAWVNLNTPRASLRDVMVVKSSVSSFTNYALLIDNGSLSAGVGWGVAYNSATCGTVFTKLTTTPSTGVWYHVAGVYDSTAQTLTLYVNGSNVASSSTTGCPPAYTGPGNDLTLGTQYNGATTALNGTLDDARVYSRALTAGEVWRLYNGAP